MGRYRLQRLHTDWWRWWLLDCKERSPLILMMMFLVAWVFFCWDEERIQKPLLIIIEKTNLSNYILLKIQAMFEPNMNLEIFKMHHLFAIFSADKGLNRGFDKFCKSLGWISDFLKKLFWKSRKFEHWDWQEWYIWKYKESYKLWVVGFVWGYRFLHQ